MAVRYYDSEWREERGLFINNSLLVGVAKNLMAVSVIDNMVSP